MLHALLLLLAFVTDCEALSDIAHRALTLGLVNVSLLCCISAWLAVRRWLASRSQAHSSVRRVE